MDKQTEIRGIPGWLVLMGLLTMCVPLGIDLYLPAFPDIARDYATNTQSIERTMPVFLLGMALGQLLYGPFSDRFGRRLPLYVGVVLFTAGSLVCALAPSLPAFMVGRAIQALGCGACMVVPRAVIRDHYQTQAAARAMSMLLLVTAAAPLIAPSLGGQILRFADWPAVFYLQAVFGLALLAAMPFHLRESLPMADRQALSVWAAVKTYGSLLAHRQFLAMSLAGGLAMGALFAYLTGSPRVFIEVYGLSPQWYGPLFGLNAVVMVITSQLNARLLRRRHPSALLQRLLWVWPWAGLLTVLITATLGLPFWLLLVMIAVFMAGLGMINPNSAALALAWQGRRLGSASAMMGALQFLGGTLGGLAVSIWRTDDALNLIVVMAACMLGSCIVGLWGLRLSRRLAAQQASAAAAAG